jgi:hypothetical protein
MTKTSLDKRSIAVVAAQEPVQMVTRYEKSVYFSLLTHSGN